MNLSMNFKKNSNTDISLLKSSLIFLKFTIFKY